MKVKDVMTRNVIYAEVPGDTKEALELMLKYNVSGLPVVKRKTKKLVGIVTRSDIINKPDESQLALVMRKDVVYAREEDDLKTVAKIFLEKNFRRMPVVKDDELIGIITISDIVWKGLANMNIKEPVEKYMKKNFHSIWEDTPIRVAYKILKFSGEKALLVLDSNGNMVGIMEDADILKSIEIRNEIVKSEVIGGTEGDAWSWDSKNVIYVMKSYLDLPMEPIKKIMTKNIVTVTKRTTISNAARKMAKHKINQMPVIEASGELIGIVRDVDMLKAILK